ncbi:hypothetical protein GCM10009579_06560 [Streptomyces javensis]|uniref:Uncharacterized protein n=1 Tax=Streptomyces javensis TaxID=114698 RepID=A0ABP4H882_9ACTN
MSTDMYGVRVLAVDPDELRARLQGFVVYYDVGSRTHIPLPDEEPNTFLHFLWEAASGYLGDGDDRTGPLGRALRMGRYQRPPVHLRMHDFYYERGGTYPIWPDRPSPCGRSTPRPAASSTTMSTGWTSGLQHRRRTGGAGAVGLRRRPTGGG